jgi:lipopolysaccharide export system permease protein
MLPVFAGALAVGLALLWFNNDVLPDANHDLRTLTIDIRRKKPTINLRNGVFSQDIPGYSILARRTFEKTNDLEGVTLFDYTNPGVNVCITAERGTISFSPDFRKLIMDLKRGEIHELDLQRMMAYRKIRFESHRIAMDVEGFDFTRSSESAFQRGNRELGAPAMMVIVDSLRRARDAVTEALRARTSREADSLLAGQPVSTPSPYVYAPGSASAYTALNDARMFSTTVATEIFRIENFDRQVDQYMVEIHKKYSIPMACLVFVLIGVPLGIMSRRGGFGTAATLSLGFFVLYYACLIGGEKLADRGILTPFTGMWSANIIISMMGIYLTVRVARETVVIDWSFLTRLLPRKWRARLQANNEPVQT